MAFEYCCFCFTLNTACIILGVVGLFFDIALLGLVGWKSFVIHVALDVLLITGAAMRKHLCLLPWMIFNTLAIIVEWIVILCLLFARSLLSSLFSSASDQMKTMSEMQAKDVYDSGSIINNFFILLIILAALISGIHYLLVKVVFDHFNELREEERRGQFQPNVPPNAFMNMSTLVSQPIAASAPATVYKPDLPCV